MKLCLKEKCDNFFAGATLGYPLALYQGCTIEAYISGVGFAYISTFGASGQGFFYPKHMDDDLVFRLITTSVWGHLLFCLDRVHLA
jgi:hypothetical protein